MESFFESRPRVVDYARQKVFEALSTLFDEIRLETSCISRFKRMRSDKRRAKGQFVAKWMSRKTFALSSIQRHVPVPNIDSHELPGNSAIVRRLPRSSIFSLMCARSQTKSLYLLRTSQFLFLKLGRVVCSKRREYPALVWKMGNISNKRAQEG